MNYFRNLEEYMAHMHGKAEELIPVEVQKPVEAKEPVEESTEEKPKKRTRKKKGDE